MLCFIKLLQRLAASCHAPINVMCSPACCRVHVKVTANPHLSVNQQIQYNVLSDFTPSLFSLPLSSLQSLSGRAAASTRILEYYSSSKLLEYSIFSTRVLVNFYFRLQISISVAVFLQPINELLEMMQTWGFAISFATCQPGNRPEYWPFGLPSTLTHHSPNPVFVFGRLY